MTLAIALGGIVVLLGLDQLFKFLAITFLAHKDTLPLIQNVLHLTYLENDGAAFGLFSGKQWILILVTVILVAAALYLLIARKIRAPFLMYSVALIVAGGLGNLIDRVFRGYVVDYIDVRLIGFAVFNLADCCVVIGTILALIYLLILEPRKEKKMIEEIEEDVEEGEQELAVETAVEAPSAEAPASDANPPEPDEEPAAPDEDSHA